MVRICRSASIQKMRRTMADDFRQSGFRLMLSLCFTLFGAEGYSAEASANASAFVTFPVSVNSAVEDHWGTSFMSGANVGRLSIRITGASLPAEAGNGANETAYYALANGTRFAQVTMPGLIKRIAGGGMLSGEPVSGLTVSAADVAGFVTVTLAYN
jgi:hypothetical protein